ncbi:hypothetical protein CapIbe_008672 [Capra ibex]
MARISGRVSIPWTLMSSTPGGAPEPTGRTGGPATGEERLRPQGAPRSGPRRGRVSPGHHPELGGSPGGDCRPSLLRTQVLREGPRGTKRTEPSQHGVCGRGPCVRPHACRGEVERPRGRAAEEPVILPGGLALVKHGDFDPRPARVWSL